jgi:hypothetical protein
MRACPIKSLVCAVGVFTCLTLEVSALYAVNFQERYNSALSEISQYLEDTGQDDRTLDVSTNAPATPEYIAFNATYSEFLVNGGIKRKFSGHSLYVKLLFQHGGYDSYTQTYKAIPALVVNDDTAGLISRIVTIGTNTNVTFKNLSLHIEFGNQTVVFNNNNISTETVTLQYSDLSSAWAANAVSYCATHLGAKYCLVPQQYWDGSYHYGLVVTANTPLYYTTNFPQDFVELYKKESENLSYKPVVYSLPVKIAFVLSQDQKNIWQVRPMTPDEVGEAMVERAPVARSIPDDSVTVPRPLW